MNWRVYNFSLLSIILMGIDVAFSQIMADTSHVNEQTVKLCEQAHNYIEDSMFDEASATLNNLNLLIKGHNKSFEYGLVMKTYGFYYYSKKQYNLALECLNISNKILSSFDDWKNLEESLKLTYYVYEAQDNIEKALEYSFKAQIISDKSPGKIHNSYCSIGYFYQMKGQYDSAEFYYNKCLDYRKLHQLHNRILDAYGNLQYLYRITNRYKDEMNIGNEKIAYCMATNDSIELGEAVWSQASLLAYLGDSSAVQMFYKSLGIGEKSGNQNTRVRSLMGIGDFYTKNNQVKTALPYYNQAIDICYSYNLSRNGAYAELSLVNSYITLDSLDEAEQHLNKAMIFNEKSNYEQQKPYIYYNYALLYKIRGDYKLALNYVDQGISICRKHRNVQKEFEFALIKAEIFIDADQLSKCNQTINEIEEDKSFCKNENFQLELARIKYLYSKKLNRFNEALSYLEQYRNLEEQKANKDFLIRAQKQSVIYETEQKDKEKQILLTEKKALDLKIKQQKIIVLVVSLFSVITTILLFVLVSIRKKLLQTQELIIAKREKIQKLNDAKDKYFALISHDLRGPLGNIYGFSKLLAGYIESDNYSEIKESAHIIENQSFLILSTLDNLLQWARSQQSGMVASPSFNEIKPIIDSVYVFSKVKLTEKQIKLTLDTDDSHIAYFDKRMIEVVVRNLLMNAIKFTQPGGEILISTMTDSDKLVVCVRDNGTGMDIETQDRIFDPAVFESKKGTNKEKGSGLGLKICSEFVRLNKGHIWVDSDVGSGSSFYFSCSKNQWE